VRKHYTIEDLEFFYNAKTLFYEIGYDGQPVKHSDIVGDNHGDLLHVGIRDGEYNICYYIFVGEDSAEVEECIAGQKLLLKILNNGNIEPIESGVDTENIFNQLGESIKKIIKEEMDDFEWARQSLEEYPYYRPEGRRPRVGEAIRVTSKDTSWMGTDPEASYQECFENPNDIIGVVVDVNIDWIEVSFWCHAGEYDADFYIPFSTEPNSGFRNMDYYGIKIMPHNS